MSVITGKRICNQFILTILFTSFSLVFFNRVGFTQPPVEQDNQIDPNTLKEASPSALQNYLKDKNQGQNPPGEDIHKKRITTLKNETKVARDSTLKDNYKNKVNNPEAVYGSSLFSNQEVMQLSELSTPPADYPIGVGDHIVVSLWGGADF